MTTTAKFAEAYTRRYGLHIVPLPPRTKRPVTEDWGHDLISDPARAAEYYTDHPDWNIGVALGPSRLCSLDVDDIDAMTIICDEFGLKLSQLHADSPTIQGAAKGFRVMFSIPDGMSLPYHSLTWPKQDGTKGRFTVFELRAACDGQARQDVFPPSIHPDTGRPYVWLTRPNGHFPEPPAWLLAIWQNWDRFKPQLQAMCPWAPALQLPAPAATSQRQGDSVIDAFNAANDIESTLQQYGYKKIGKRWLSPHSQTKLPGVNVFPDGRAWIHHASDPLCSDDSGRPVNAFDLFCYYDHGGDLKAAVKAAADVLGLKPTRPERPPRPVRAPAGEIDPETGEILPPVAATPAAPAPPPDNGIALWEQLGLALNGKGRPLMNLDNAVRAIENDPELRGKIWYDEFLDAIVTIWQGPQREWKDVDDVLLQLYLQRFIGLTDIGVKTCNAAALVAAFHDTRNECREWMTSLVWDGVPRLNHLMPEGFGTEENEYTSAVGRCWVLSMVARVMRPGCKVDTVPVLEGSQGAGKSTALSILGGKWFTECHESVLTKDFYGVLQGHMLVEIAEMHSFTRAEVERVKGIISCQKDRYRKAYGRNTEDHPRQTVLACTTNRDDWQKDDTGARRFWPVHCGKVDHEWLRRNRDQLFAEAVALFNEGASWWDVPVTQQQAEVEARRDVDSWEPVIERFLTGKDKILVSDILSDCLKIELGRHDQIVQKRVGRILRALGWQTHVLRGYDGKSRKTWVKL